MGRNIGSGVPIQRISSLYENKNLQKPAGLPEGRRTMPGGLLVPRLPENPYAKLATQMVKRTMPRLTRKPNDMF